MNTMLHVSDMGQTVASNVAALRRQRGLSLNELARVSGLAKNTLVNIEKGEANPTVETLHLLTRGLGATIVELISSAPSRGPQVIRAADGPRIEGRQMHVRILYRLASPPLSIETYEIRLDPGSSQDSPAHSPGVVEEIYVTEGKLRAGPVDRIALLDAGDFCCFEGDVPHRYEAGDREARAIMIIATPIVAPIVHSRPVDVR